MDQLIQSQGKENPRNFALVIESSDTYLTYTPKKGNIREYKTRKKGNMEGLLAHILEVLLAAQKKRQRHVCFKCGWPWYSKVGATRPNKCPNCGDKNWDRPYALGHLTGRGTAKADEPPR
jgi:DNA-directed RNA polymerase subunit RPC12/RpoP